VCSRDDLSDRDKIGRLFDCLTGPFKTTFLLRICPSASYSIVSGFKFSDVYAAFKRQFETHRMVQLNMGRKFNQLPRLSNLMDTDAIETFIDSLRPIAAICASVVPEKTESIYSSFSYYLFARLPKNIVMSTHKSESIGELIARLECFLQGANIVDQSHP